MRAIRFVLKEIQNPGELLEGFWEHFLNPLLWGNGTAYGSMYTNGVLWFLVALFYAKLLYRIILRYVREYRLLFCLFIAFCGMWIGSVIRLPQCLDLIPLAVLFMEVGHLLKKHEDVESDCKQLVGAILFCAWIYMCYTRGIFIEMAIRSYPASMLSILAAIMGSICVMQFSKSLEGIGGIARGFSFLGRYSLELLCIHFLDGAFLFLYRGDVFALKKAVAGSESETVHRLVEVAVPFVSCLIRVGIDVLLLVMWVYFVRFIKSKRNVKNS